MRWLTHQVDLDQHECHRGPHLQGEVDEDLVVECLLPAKLSLTRQTQLDFLSRRHGSPGIRHGWPCCLIGSTCSLYKVYDRVKEGTRRKEEREILFDWFNNRSKIASGKLLTYVTGSGLVLRDLSSGLEIEAANTKIRQAFLTSKISFQVDAEGVCLSDKILSGAM